MNKNKGAIREIASARIASLYLLSNSTLKKNPILSRRYVMLMKEISTHYKVPLPANIKNNVCKKCGCLLVPGISSKVRLVSSKGFVSNACNNCGAEVHINYRKA